MSNGVRGQIFGNWLEQVGRKIPDPVIIFMVLLPLAILLSIFMSGHEFQSMGAGGEPVTYSIEGMHQAEHVRWLFDNALVDNWLAFGGGVLGVILVVMLAIGIAEHSGLFAALIKRVGLYLPSKILPIFLILLGILSSIATDAGYLVLIPLAGVLYAGIGRNPLIGMAAAFAGVSAGFGANVIPGSVDVIIGMNAQAFAEAQGVPFENVAGQALNPVTMNYWFILTSTFVLALTGAWVTHRWVQPRLDKQSWEVPEEVNFQTFEVNDAERRGLRASLLGLLVSALVIGGLIIGPLGAYTDEAGQTVRPYQDNIILLITLFFAIVGVFFGVAAGTFKRTWDVVQAMVAQMNTLGYVLVLTFFCFNFLQVLGYTGLGAWITYLGSQGLLALGVQQYPILLIIGFIFTVALINLFVGGLTSKWMLLGPIFIPMLYYVNPNMTPDLVAAAYRVADSSTNIITPMMTYAGVILAFMRKYKPEMGFGDMLIIMIPYSMAFMLVWPALLIGFYVLGIPLGF